MLPPVTLLLLDSDPPTDVDVDKLASSSVSPRSYPLSLSELLSTSASDSFEAATDRSDSSPASTTTTSLDRRIFNASMAVTSMPPMCKCSSRFRAAPLNSNVPD